MSSQVEIANMALDLIGTRSTISSLSEGSPEANAISRHWSNALDCCLRAAHWNFARRQVALTLLLDATQDQAVPIPWLYEYAYPSDCVMFRQLLPIVQLNTAVATGTPAPAALMGPPPKFMLGTDLDTTGNPIEVILTNQIQGIGIYTFRNANTQMFDPLFVQCLSAFLGSRVAIPLTGDKGMKQMAVQLADTYAVQAQAKNGNEGITVIDNMPDWIKVRGYAADWGNMANGQFYGSPQPLTLYV
jgi:hypothetical protein